jgi:hypothetical protein
MQELRIPAFTAYSLPNIEKPVLDGKQKLIWYGRLNAIGALQLGLSGKNTKRLRLSIAPIGKKSSMPIDATNRARIPAPGFYSFTVEGVGEVDALVLSGEASVNAQFKRTRRRSI